MSSVDPSTINLFTVEHVRTRVRGFSLLIWDYIRISKYVCVDESPKESKVMREFRSHCGENVDAGLVCCNAVWTCRQMMETAFFTSYKSTASTLLFLRDLHSVYSFSVYEVILMKITHAVTDFSSVAGL